MCVGQKKNDTPASRCDLLVHGWAEKQKNNTQQVIMTHWCMVGQRSRKTTHSESS